jgi:threonine aldolase
LKFCVKTINHTREGMMKTIDLRSDTVTLPTPAMRQAMAEAPVGDDVYGEDPTVNQLQAMAAGMLGKEAALFVPSGTMGNLAAILAHCTRGDEVILGNQAHTFLFEAGGISALGGVHSCQIPNQPDGTLDLDDIRHAIRADDAHQPITRLVSLENTHNRCGGVALSVEYTQAVAQLCHQNGIQLHLDGARLFNAAAAQGVPASALAGPADSVTFCLSKGLCAPVGSLICGTQDFIRRAHRIRKQLGGGMRQAGILAAAGIVALESMPACLADDHTRAHRLAQQLADIPGLVLDPGTPYTNMIFMSLSGDLPDLDAQGVADRLLKKGVKVGAVGARRFRLVTHYWIDDEDIDRAAAAFSEVLQTNQ